MSQGMQAVLEVEDEETHSPLEPPEEMQPYQHINFKT